MLELLRKCNPLQRFPNFWYYFFYASLIIGGFIYARINPYDPHSLLPPCIIYKTTGFFCAGCGSQRALHELFAGHFLLAFGQNPLFVIFVVLCSVDFLALLFKLEKLRPVPRILKSNYASLVVLVLILVFIILRNLPFESLAFLTPKIL